MEKQTREQRKYQRLETVFPIEFQIVDDQKSPKSELIQGFTKNVGKGGMCVEIKSEKTKTPFNFVPGETKLKVIINIPSSIVATESYCTIRWSKKVSEYALDTYLLGIEYNEIDSVNQRMIERHVLWLCRKPKVVLVFFLVFLIFAILLTYLGIQPIR